ncbi:MAG: hypothetical protein U0T81_04850 [Saprospiraceae bacterium]
MSENRQILLVEDDRNFGDVLRSYLEMHNYEVDLAVDGISRLKNSEEARMTFVFWMS